MVSRRFAELQTQLDRLQNAPALVLPSEADVKHLSQSGSNQQSAQSNDSAPEKTKDEEVK